MENRRHRVYGSVYINSEPDGTFSVDTPISIEMDFKTFSDAEKFANTWGMDDRRKSQDDEFVLKGFIKWEAFTPGGTPEHGQEVIAIHRFKEELMMYDAKYSAFLGKSSFIDRPSLLMTEKQAIDAGFPPHGRFYCLGSKYQEYVTHWKPISL